VARVEEIGRYEYKYAIPLALRREIVEMAAPFTLPDPHGLPIGDGAMGYDVHSLYFDTERLADLYARLDSRKIRDRLRLRTYGEAGEKQALFLENKRKFEQWVIKSRVRITDADTWAAHPSDRPWIDLCAAYTRFGRYGAIHFARLMERDHRVPVSVVHYQRAVYVARDPNQPKTRLTMDCQICAGFPKDAKELWVAPTVDLLPPDWMVLELKFDGDRPGWMRELCRNFHLRAMPVSKFGLSVVHLHRPDNRHALRFLTPRPFKRALGGGAEDRGTATSTPNTAPPASETPPAPQLPGYASQIHPPGVVDS
jgi:hypothetical protein